METGIIRSIRHFKFKVLYGFTEREKKKKKYLSAEVLSQFHAFLTNSYYTLINA